MANLCPGGAPRLRRSATPLLRRAAAAVAVLLAVTLTGPPPAAYAAVGTITTKGQGLRADIALLGAINRSPKSIVPGNSATPTVTVTNTGDVAAPNTVITIPAPPTGTTIDVTGGGT
ncbi:hypothetical protein AB0M20_36610, partial [Actinoplanes sp. NPDC051633]|uniref:hypothetical protein n=1 Tax=Actinoplanes sp. NPDC051633 TaxID=3155670 RepID=UPI00343E1C7C